MALHKQEAQVMALACAVKGIPFGYSLTQVKAQSNCIRAESFSPLPLLPSSQKRPDGLPPAYPSHPIKGSDIESGGFNKGA